MDNSSSALALPLKLHPLGVLSSAGRTIFPILAKEGFKCEVGGRGLREGLLVADPTDRDNSNDLAKADPVTKQYPFLTVASGESGDLSTTYFLLSKNPSLLERYKEEATQQALEEQEARTSRKRK